MLISLSRLAVLSLLLFPYAQGIAEDIAIPFYDAHIHYSQDVWEDLPASQAVELLKQNGIEKALVSATPGEGAVMLYQEAPEIVIPMLRPYRNWRHRHTWFNDPALKPYLLEQLKRAPFAGFGEFHVFGDDASLAPVRQMIAMANEKNMLLHAHTDTQGIQHILSKAQGTVIWAHGGFDVPVATLKHLLDANAHLYIELSYREGIVDENQQLTHEWREFFMQYPQRFLLGMDTYKPSRWADLPVLADEARQWLKQLPDSVATAIATQNFSRLVLKN